jgi:N-acetylglucosaminyldiphosphoundecaprenol N-acetyl-beta-D-mannosaminyltransferase
VNADAAARAPRVREFGAGAHGPRTVNVLGVNVAATDLAGATQRILDMVAQRQRSYVCVTGVHGIMESRSRPDLQRVHNAAGLVTPDGMPLVYICRAAGHPECGRVYGPDLMLAVCAAAQERGYRQFFYGATPRTLERLTARLHDRFPDLAIAGSFAPPFRAMTAAERAQALEHINRCDPDIIWIGLGTPKQERWMAENRAELDAAVLIGVGAAFDFHAGNVRQAPRWMQPLCLEWLFRLAVEPKRLWKRYVRIVPAFVFHFALQRLGVRGCGRP